MLILGLLGVEPDAILVLWELVVWGFSGEGVTAEKIGLGMVDSRDWVVMVTAGSSPVLNGEVVKGDAPAGILIWYE